VQNQTYDFKRLYRKQKEIVKTYDIMKMNMIKILDIKKIRGIDSIYPSTEKLTKLLSSDKQLTVYLGVDPTGTRLHIGHSIPLSILQTFADAGHKAILLFGTGTVLVGDPSQRLKARKKITHSEIEQNMKDWKKQVEHIIDFSKIKIVHNSDWLLKLSLSELISIASNISAVQLFKRDNFQKRLEQQDTVYFHETMYPLLQGYDSVYLNADIEIGGTDQTFNMLIGRELMQKMRKKEKFVITNSMILGTDGNIMSKTSGNCIWLSDSPQEAYGKLMSIPDSIMESYCQTITSLDFQLLTSSKSPIDVKKNIAYEIVKKIHGESNAVKAQAYFEKTVQKKELPDKITTIKINVTDTTTITDVLLLTKTAKSKSHAKDLITGGAVEKDSIKITNPKDKIGTSSAFILRVGKRKVVKVLSSS
jgi:tyrosyl-tRNA synthetase